MIDAAILAQMDDEYAMPTDAGPVHHPRVRLSVLDKPRSLAVDLFMTTTVTGKNQITLPIELVKELGLRPGVQIEWSKASDGSIIGRRKLTRAELASRLAGRGRRYLRPGSDPVRDLVLDRVREDDEEGAA
jgi:bifunctional DNA-binding transcriptional regulator/antitoxin component of YhaV-PrlF toxin-antitoxin module